MTERLGQGVLYPGRAARRLLSGGRGGLRDVLWLLGLRVLAVETVSLAQGFSRIVDEGLSAPFQALLQAGRSVLLDVLVVLCGATLLSLLLGEREARLRPGMSLDLSAQALLPWLFIHVHAALLFTLLGWGDPPERLRRVVQGVALLSYAWAFWAALRAARRAVWYVGAGAGARIDKGAGTN